MIDLKEELNNKQYEAASTIEGPILIIAGAGSGKTRMITFRIANMIEKEKIAPKNILALTFTNKAAREMESRIEKMTRANSKDLTISTFHAFGVQILRKHISVLGYNQRFTIYDSADQQSAIKEAARENQIDIASLNLYDLQNIFSSIKTGRASWDASNRLYKNLYESYNHLLKIYNAVDFDDLILLPILLLKENPAILQSYQERYRYIMVDEFQDTSLLQYELIALIAKKYQNICVVGDDDQSIYSWRGANYQNILLFEKDFPSRKEIMLEQNYRSSGNILSAANSVIAHNHFRKEKKLWTPDAQGKIIDQFYPKDEFEEAQNISSLIHSIKMEEAIPYKDFGILVRTNSLTSVIEEQLLEDNIPYRVSGGSSFFQRKEIKDLIAYLKIMINPDDEISLLRIINIPRRGIGAQTVKKIRDIAQEKHISFYSTMKLITVALDGGEKIGESQKKSIQELIELIEKYSELFKGKEIAAKTRDFIQEINYWTYLLFDNPNNENLAKFKYTNLIKFVEMIERWEKNPDNFDVGLERYLHRITLITTDEENSHEEEAQGKVNLMTIHASKGLEFDTVFIAGVEDHIIPHAKSIEEDEKNIEEERRLFYVAITRAKRKLYLSSCQTRKRNNTITSSLPSRFLEEIPGGLLKTIEEVDSNPSEEEGAAIFANIFAQFK